MSKYNIVYREDVIKELQKNTGKPIELLEEMIQLHYDRLHDIINNHDKPYIIIIPFIGKLRMNYFLTMSYYKLYYDKVCLKHIDFFKDLMKKEGAKLKNFRKPLFLTQYFSTHIEEDNRGGIKNMFRFIRSLEELHNEWYKKKFKNN